MKNQDQVLSLSNYLDGYDIATFKKLYIIGLIIGFILRMVYSLTAIGIYHPDEIFQSIEMAHYLVYGYGFIPPEFRTSNSITPSYAKARSWIIPLFIAFYFRFAEFMGWSYWGVTLPILRVLIGFNSFLMIPSTKSLAESISKDKRVGYVSGFFVAIWWKIAYITSRPLFNVFFLPIYLYAISLFYRRLSSHQQTKLTIKEWIVYFFGFGISTYVRLDFLILLFSFTIVNYYFERKANRTDLFFNQINTALITGILGWLFGMAVDAQMYEGWKDFGVVPIHWFQFNIVESKSDGFGVVPFGWYGYRLIVVSGLITITLALLLFGGILVYLHKNKPEQIPVLFPNRTLLFEFEKLFLVVILAWIIYETPWRAGLLFWLSKSHKEERFVMNLYFIYFILLAMMVVLLAEFLERYLDQSKTHIPKHFKKRLTPQMSYNLTIFLFIGLITFSSLLNILFVPSQQYGADITKAIVYVGRQEDVTGVIIVEKWYLTTSYSYLHKDVPLYWINYDLPKEFSDLIQNTVVNYIIVPKYKYALISNLFQELVDNGFLITKIIDGTTEIWFRA